MFGFGGAVCPICSPCDRTSGNAACQVFSPCFRYDTSTFAFPLSSPATRHSKPSDTSVGGSVQKTPGRVLLDTAALCGPVDWAHAAAPSSASSDAARTQLNLKRSEKVV